MGSHPAHHVTTSDGVTIGGSVHGQGPPLVLSHGVIGDGDLDWQAVLPYLIDRFTCYLPCWRGRGLSDDHPDLSPGRRVDDLIAYVESIGEQIGLVGWSGGASLVLGVAAESAAVDAVASLEPSMASVIEEQERAALVGSLTSAGDLAAEGRLTDAARAWGAGFVFHDEEIAALETTGYFEAAGPYAPNLLELFQQAMGYEGPTPDDATVLGAISAPVLILHGSETTPYFARSARYVADHVPNARLQQIPGAGHAAPLTHPEPLAEALAAFFSPAP